MKATLPAPNLTFANPDDNRFPFILFLCVLGSFLAHAGTFFLFQVVYPQRVTIPHPAPRVSLLTPSSPENVALLRWIEAEDPALVANDRPTAPPGLVDVHYRPSFAAPRTAPLGAPTEQSQGVHFPPAVDRLSAANSAAHTSGEAATPRPVATTIVYSSALSGRPIVKNPPLHFSTLAKTAADFASVLVGITDQGEVRFTVLQHSSGDPMLDDFAQAHLRQIVFAPVEAPLTWGFATLTWGSDAYAPARQSP
jgi:hypothetical protein